MKDSKQKKLTFKLIERDDPEGALMYALLDELVTKHHDELSEARIALAGNLERELMPYDFVIVLLQEFWEDAEVTEAQRRALLDHELCHGTILRDKDGEPVEDERSRKMYRLRKHDIEEFSEIVARHGCYKSELEELADALLRSRQGDLFRTESTRRGALGDEPKSQSGPRPM